MAQPARDRRLEHLSADLIILYMEGNYSNPMREVLAYSREEAARRGQGQVGTEHLLLGIIHEDKSAAAQILRKLGCDLLELKEQVERNAPSTGRPLSSRKIALTREADKIVKIAYLEAKLYKSDHVGTEHLLFSLLRDGENLAAEILQQGFTVTYEAVRAEVEPILRLNQTIQPEPDQDRGDETKPIRHGRGRGGWFGGLLDLLRVFAKRLNRR